MGEPETVTMVGGNVAHTGEQFGDEDDMLLISLEFSDKKFAFLEYGSAFQWPEHYVLVQGTKGAIRLDMANCGMTLKTTTDEQHFLLHETQEEDDDRTNIYCGNEQHGAIRYGKPGNQPPMWLQTIMNNEMKYFNDVLHGAEVGDEFKPLLTGAAARAAIATADALTMSLNENRKVRVSEVK